MSCTRRHGNCATCVTMLGEIWWIHETSICKSIKHLLPQSLWDNVGPSIFGDGLAWFDSRGVRPYHQTSVCSLWRKKAVSACVDRPGRRVVCVCVCVRQTGLCDLGFGAAHYKQPFCSGRWLILISMVACDNIVSRWTDGCYTSKISSNRRNGLFVNVRSRSNNSHHGILIL